MSTIYAIFCLESGIYWDLQRADSYSAAIEASARHVGIGWMTFAEYAKGLCGYEVTEAQAAELDDRVPVYHSELDGFFSGDLITDYEPTEALAA